jgi:hypothetical protein
MAAQATGAPVAYRQILPAVAMYGGLAAAFVWLGIGSILARRWARALVLILAWLWLLTGVITVGFMIAFLPKILAASSSGSPIPAVAQVMMLVVMLGILSVCFIVVPGLLVLFYRSPHVKATCAAQDPVTRWTEACPLPVLGLSLVLAFGAVSMLPMLVFNCVAPCFGRLVSGPPGALIIFAMIAVWSYCARAVYRLQPAGWWTILIVFSVMTVSALVTFARVDLLEMYRLMGYPEEQIKQIEQYNFLFKGGNMLWLMSASVLPVFGYLLYVKKFFRQST